MPPVMIFVVVAAVVVIAVLGHLAARKRREAMTALAARLGLRFSPHRSRALARQYNFMNRLRSGGNRYAYNVLAGTHQGHDTVVFDYHYQTGSGKNTHHHYLSFFILHLPIRCPELTVAPEGFLSKIAQAVGYDDIDFESHEFSRRFCVRCRDKKFAYDVCHVRTIEYLLANEDLTMEIDGNAMAIWFDSRLEPEQIEPNLNRLIVLRSLMPDYLFAGR